MPRFKDSSQLSMAAEAAAIGYSRSQQGVPVLETLVCDDAPQFTGITDDLSLCWVHEGRHCKKLSPVVPLHQTLLEDVLGRFWTYYRELRAYQQAPTAAEKTRLEVGGDTLFGTQTGHGALNERIAKVVSDNSNDFPPRQPDGRCIYQGIEYISGDAFLALVLGDLVDGVADS